jgi:hypothetical protein
MEAAGKWRLGSGVSVYYILCGLGIEIPKNIFWVSKCCSYRYFVKYDRSKHGG